jgi:hypothetical protein
VVRGREDLRHHEVAHAAMDMVLGIPVKQVRVVPGYGYVGYLEFEYRRSSHEGAVRVIMSTLAESRDPRERVREDD